ncbi:MAG TPA: AtpZ/AtpI family protein [Polyangiaceae bacterium]|nr:AtpZ/AtpI family protein [Polyangiaceae bacterium]
MKRAAPNGQLEKAVERRSARAEKWRHEGERPLGRNLALAGALGWLVVVPTLLGAFSGRALDRTCGTGVAFSAALMCLGLVVGCWLAWQRMRSA